MRDSGGRNGVVAGELFYTNWLYYIIYILYIISIHKGEYENGNNESEGQISHEWHIVKGLKVLGNWHKLCPQLTVKWDEHHGYHRKYYSRFMPFNVLFVHFVSFTMSPGPVPFCTTMVHIIIIQTYWQDLYDL